MARKIHNPDKAPGGQHKLAVAEIWKTVDRLTAPPRSRGTSALRIWAVLWLFRDPKTGVVDIERDDLAAIADISLARTSRILTTLEKTRLIRRIREPIPGRQGPGKVVIAI